MRSTVAVRYTRISVQRACFQFNYGANLIFLVVTSAIIGSPSWILSLSISPWPSLAQNSMSRDQAGCTQEPGCSVGAAEIRSAFRFGFNDSAIRFLVFLIDVNLPGRARRSDGAKVFTNDQK